MEIETSYTGMYIHVPFCKSRCTYCGFYSQTLGSVWQQRYVEALRRESMQRCKEAKTLRTIYFGGGTPSVLYVRQVEEIMESIRSYYNICDGAEITFEMNPDDVSAPYIRCLIEAGINRFSIGIQSFRDELLLRLKRRHSSQQAINAVYIIDEEMRRHGRSNISIDLMYGLPGQSTRTWNDDVAQALELPVRHISAYALTYEEGTPLYRMLKDGTIKSVPDDDSVDMFRFLTAAARERGFVHYEISNFAMPGFESRHNSSYWQGTPYIGLGPGAHSYDEARQRRWNTADLQRYIAEEKAPFSYELLTERDLFNEKMLTRLRTAEGLDIAELSDSDKRYVLDLAKRHVEGGRLEIVGQRLKLTFEGILTSNDIISDFIKL